MMKQQFNKTFFNFHNRKKEQQRSQQDLTGRQQMECLLRILNRTVKNRLSHSPISVILPLSSS